MKAVRIRSPRLGAALAVLAAASGVCAQTVAATEGSAAADQSAAALSFNIGLITDNRYRGISQSRLKPAVSAGADYGHPSGWYAGTWLTTIRWIKDAGGDAPVEWDIYGGYKGAAGPIGYDVGVLRYQYPGHKLGISPNTTEVYGALSWEMLTLKYSHSVTNLFGFSDSKNSGYLDLSASFDLGDGWSLAPHVGHQWIRNNSEAAYTDYAIALAKDFGNGLVASAAVIGTDASKSLYVTPSGRFTGRTGLLVGLKYSF